METRPQLYRAVLALCALLLCVITPALAEAAPEKEPPELKVESKKARPEIKVESKSTKALPTGENKTGVSTQSISVPKGPGTIEGMGESFSAQASTGIATFTVPFALPTARGDAQPSLGLSYSSASGNDVAGIGWGVGGCSSV